MIKHYPNKEGLILTEQAEKKPLNNQKENILKIKEVDYKKLINYKSAYYILIEYFDSISEEEQHEVHKKLNRLGL